MAVPPQSAPHNIPSDGSPNPAFGKASAVAQYPVAEVVERDVSTSAAPLPVTTDQDADGFQG